MAVPSIQDWIQQINPAYWGANTGQYVSQANNLYQQLAGLLAGYDTQEQASGRNYENNLAQLAFNQTRGMQALKDKLANRGMLRSGQYTRQSSDLTGQYNMARSGLTSGHEGDLAQLATNRLNAQSGYTTNLTGLQNQIATEGQNTMLQNMGQQALGMNTAAELARQNQIAALQQQVGQAQLQQLQNQNQQYSQTPGQQPGYVPLSTTPSNAQTSSVQSNSPVVPSKVPPKVPPAVRPVYGKY